MMTYPRENDKGKFIGHFWAIFNAGAVLGSVIAFIINKDVAVAASLSGSIYAAFISIMLIGTLTAFSLAPPSSVSPTQTVTAFRSKSSHLDGRAGSHHEALPGLAHDCLDPHVPVLQLVLFLPVLDRQRPLLLDPYPVLEQHLLLVLADRGLLVLCSYTRIPGRQPQDSFPLGSHHHCLLRRYLGWRNFLQTGYKVTDAKGNHDCPEGASYVGPLFLYMFYGLNDAAWQTYSYWLMGALSNNVTVLSRYSGFYKSIQSCGAAVAWRINAAGTSFMTELIICFAFLVASIPGALFLSMRIKDRSDDDQEEYDHDHRDMKIDA